MGFSKRFHPLFLRKIDVALVFVQELNNRAAYEADYLRPQILVRVVAQMTHIEIQDYPRIEIEERPPARSCHRARPTLLAWVRRKDIKRIGDGRQENRTVVMRRSTDDAQLF